MSTLYGGTAVHLSPMNKISCVYTSVLSRRKLDELGHQLLRSCSQFSTCTSAVVRGLEPLKLVDQQDVSSRKNIMSKHARGDD